MPSAFLNSLREEGSREDILRWLEKLYDENLVLEKKNAALLSALEDLLDAIFFQDLVEDIDVVQGADGPVNRARAVIAAAKGET